MPDQSDKIPRQILPIPDRQHVRLTTFDAKDTVGYAGAVSVSPGVWVYQITDDGIAAELTVKGTKYYRDKRLND